MIRLASILALTITISVMVLSPLTALAEDSSQAGEGSYRYPYDYGLDVSATNFDKVSAYFLTATWNKRYFSSSWLGLGLGASPQTTTKDEDGFETTSSAWHAGFNLEQTLFESHPFRLQAGVLIGMAQIWKKAEYEDDSIETISETVSARVVRPMVFGTFYHRWHLKFGAHIAMRMYSIGSDNTDIEFKDEDFSGLAVGLTFRAET